jgi:hypothetical protein
VKRVISLASLIASSSKENRKRRTITPAPWRAPQARRKMKIVAVVKQLNRKAKHIHRPRLMRRNNRREMGILLAIMKPNTGSKESQNIG